MKKNVENTMSMGITVQPLKNIFKFKLEGWFY